MASKEIEILIKLNDNFSSQIKKIGESTKDLEKSLSDVAKKSGLAFAGFAAAIGLSINAAKGAEATNNKLAQALRNQGLAVEENIEHLSKRATELSRMSKFDDDAIKEIQSGLITYGLSGKALDDLTASIVDYGSFVGDLGAGQQQINNAIQGTSDKVKGLDIDLKGITDTSKRAAIITQALAEKFEGQAVASIGGLAAIDLLQKSFGEITESIGNALAPAIVFLSNQLLKFTRFIEDNPAITNFIAALLVIGAGLVGLVFALTSGAIAFLKIQKAIEIVSLVMAKFNLILAANPINLTVIAIAALIAIMVILYLRFESVRQAVNSIFGVLVSLSILIFNIVKSFGQLIASVIMFYFNILKAVGIVGALVKGFELFKRVLMGIFEFIDEITMAIQKFIDKLNILLGFTGKKVKVEAEVTTTQTNTQKTNATSNVAQPVDNEQYENLLKERESLLKDHLAKTKEISDANDILDLVALQQKHQAEYDQTVANLQLVRDAKLAAGTLTKEDEVVINQQLAQAKAEFDFKETARLEKLRKQKEEFQLKDLASLKSYLSEVSAVNADAANALKAIRIGEIIIETAAGVAHALAGPFPLNLANAAVVASQGAAQVAIASGQSFAVGAVDIPQDQVAQIHAGEMIIPKTFAQGVRSGDLSIGGGSGSSPSVVNNNNFSFGDLIGTLKDEVIEMIENKINERTQIGIGGILQTAG